MTVPLLLCVSLWLLALGHPILIKIDAFKKVFPNQKLASSWGPFKLLIRSRKSTHRTRQQMQLSVMCCSLHRAFQEEESIGLSRATQGLNVVIYKKLTGVQKKSNRSHFGAVRGFCGSERLRWCVLTLGPCVVLLRALRGHSLHHTLPSKTKTYLSQANTLPALKTISSWSNARRGLCDVVQYSVFFFFVLFFNVPGHWRCSYSEMF